MVINDSKHLLFIEPTAKKMEADVNDELTQYAEYLMKKLKPKNDFTKGFHICACKKAHSASHTFTVSVGGKTYNTNNLLLHYVKNHRSEIPQNQLDILNNGMQLWKEKNKNNDNSLEANVNEDHPRPKMKRMF